MHAKRILVPTDFSTCSEIALRLAVALATGNRETSIILLHVVESAVPTYDEELGVLEPEALRANMQMLQASRDHDVRIDTEFEHGDPNTVILEFAKAHNVDLIVIGMHGRSSLVRRLVGSTTDAVLRKAMCPVMTVRDDSVLPADDIALRDASGGGAKEE